MQKCIKDFYDISSVISSEAMKESLNLPSLLHSLTNLTFACGTDIMPKRDITVITPIKIHFEYHTYITITC